MNIKKPYKNFKNKKKQKKNKLSICGLIHIKLKSKGNEILIPQRSWGGPPGNHSYFIHSHGVSKENLNFVQIRLGFIGRER